MSARRITAVLTLALCASLFAVASANAAPIVNGTFDDGLNGWTVDIQGNSSGWELVTDCNGTGACYQSSAYSDAGGVMYQEFTVPTTGMPELSLSFQALNDGNRAWRTPTQFDFNNIGENGQEARIDIMRSGTPAWPYAPGADILQNIFITETGTQTPYPWQDKKVDLSSFAGQTVQLRFSWIMREANMYFGIDNVDVYDATPPPVPDTTPPVISNAKMSAHRFLSMTSGSKLFTAARSRGANLTFDLSEAATVQLAVKRYSSSGTMADVDTASTTLDGVLGPNKGKFTARLSAKKALAPGKYLIRLTPRDAAGNVGNSADLVVRVLKPRGK